MFCVRLFYFGFHYLLLIFVNTVLYFTKKNCQHLFFLLYKILLKILMKLIVFPQKAKQDNEYFN